MDATGLRTACLGPSLVRSFFVSPSLPITQTRMVPFIKRWQVIARFRQEGMIQELEGQYIPEVF